MQLTKHFDLAQLTRSSVAQARGLSNDPPPELLPRLILTAELLERIRATLGVPVTVTSGYRSPKVNLAVGSSSGSDHPHGYAADIVAPAYGTPYDVARRLAPLVSTLGIGQIILEGIKGKRWVHVSTHTPEKDINRIITITDSGVLVGIQPLD